MRMLIENLWWTAPVLYIVIWFALFIGWIANIIRLIGDMHDPVTTMVVLRIVGIFYAPFGGVLGYVG